MVTFKSALYAALAGVAAAQQKSVGEYYTDSSLPNHTIFRPQNSTMFEKMPVVVWGNGACSANGLSHGNFLKEIASYGILAIASGGPNASGSTTAQTMKDSIDWVHKVAGTGQYANVDKTRIAAAGMSCGGIEAYAQAQDQRVMAIGIFNSGQYDAAGTSANVPKITKPIFFFLGGSSDIAYNNGMRDYAAVASGVPSAALNDKSGHGGTYSQPNGGVYGRAGAAYFRWVLRGDTTAATYFTGDGATKDGWTVQKKSLENLKTTPI